jgi:indolepyruvate ferredoxin oxidoreductase alpha subunit
VLIILDNSTTAMTGSQPHPATGKTVKGEETKRLNLEQLCRACGTDNVDVVNPYQVKEFEALLKKRLAEDALSVVISRFPCRIIERKKEPAPSFQKDKCKKCSLCTTIDCPALTKEADGTISINENICTGCNLCVETCAFGALIKK